MSSCPRRCVRAARGSALAGASRTGPGGHKRPRNTCECPELPRSPWSGGPEIDLLHLLAAADLLRRSRLQHLAEMEDGNMLGDVEYHVHVVLDEEDGEVAIELGEKPDHLRGLARRQPGGRFIQEQDLPVAGEPEDNSELSRLAVR